MRRLALTTLAAAVIGMKDGDVYRKIGFQEKFFYISSERSRPRGSMLLNYSFIFDSKRRLEERHVQMALEALQRQIPILHARVEKRDDGEYMVASETPFKLQVLPPGGNWLKEHNLRNNTEPLSNEPSGPHWSASLLQDPQNTTTPKTLNHRAVVMMTIPHTFTDGLSQSLLCGHLVRNLDQALTKGEVDEQTPAPVYPSADELLKKEPLTGSVIWEIVKAVGVMIRDRKSAFLKTYVADYDEKSIPENPSTLAPASLPADELNRVHAKCKKHGLTVNAAISAAVNLAAARMLEKTPDGQTHPGPYLLRSMFIVNLRRYFPKEVDKSQLYETSAGGAGTHVKVPSTDIKNFWPVAKQIHSSIMRQIDMRMPIVFNQRIMTNSFKLDKYNFEEELKKSLKWNFSVCDYNVNNLGSMDRVFPKTTVIKVVEVHRSFRNHPGMDHSFGAHMFQTAGGNLCYSLNYVAGRVKHEDARRFQRLVLDVLREIAHQDN